MRRRLIALCISLLGAATALPPAQAAVSVSIGINIGAYPQMVVVPGYPVYYAPALGANFFFYDGLYWVLDGDDWYMSSWYNGPWSLVQPAFVPYYLLRVPVRYYMAPPAYFRGWQPGAPPRWGQHWGPQWEQRHRDWDRWNRSAVPKPAPLPVYQRAYSGERYPGPQQQADLQARNYRYQPRAEVARDFMQQQPERRGPAGEPPRRQAQPPQPPQPRHEPRMPPSREPDRDMPPQREQPRGEGPPRREAAPPRAPERPPMVHPNESQRQPPGRAEPQERGRGREQGEPGRDRRDEGPGRPQR
ncbi:MAG: hypothetical protein GXC94_08115 [Comamonadaceae bacterium]|nr:hypothetical protein [Comamonadaceae bacterium]